VKQIILIVEDHLALRKSLSIWLESILSDCQIIQAESGEEAVAAAAAQTPDLVVMDIGLPGISGIQATRRIKALSPQTPVVMLSIHEEQAFKTDAIAAGASAFICKRMIQIELAPVVQALLSRQRDAGIAAG
jgi:two-component system, NarL family, invasion response regulator UvrY